MNDERKNLDALYEIARMLNVPASNDPPCVAVVRAVRDHLGLLRAVTHELRWTGPHAIKGRVED
jgi:hypothetical protein